MNKKLPAIILARSGSKGIKNKNLKQINGKSLLEFSIQAALNSKSVDKVFVSSDSEEYLNLAKKCGALTIKRPKNLSSDQSPSESALIHALNKINKFGDNSVDEVVFLQCTSPFTSPEDIDKAYIKFKNEDLDSLFSAVNFHGFLWSTNPVKGVNHDEKTLRVRRQDLAPEILENGAFYIFKSKFFLKIKNRFFGNVGFYIQDKKNQYEIDDMFDFDLNRFIYQKYVNYNDKININKIELIVSDFDGVFTDNNVSNDSKGREFIQTSKNDSLSVSIFRKKNPHIPFIVMTSEKNPSVKMRCRKLKLPCFQISGDKLIELKKYLKENNINPKNTIYIGNDSNDLTCLNFVGHPFIVANYDISLSRDNFTILNSNGGNGAIKEVLSYLK